MLINVLVSTHCGEGGEAVGTGGEAEEGREEARGDGGIDLWWWWWCGALPPKITSQQESSTKALHSCAVGGVFDTLSLALPSSSLPVYSRFSCFSVVSLWCFSLFFMEIFALAANHTHPVTSVCSLLNFTMTENTSFYLFKNWILVVSIVGVLKIHVYSGYTKWRICKMPIKE